MNREEAKKIVSEAMKKAHESKISNRDFAKLIGVHEREIYRWLKKENAPKSLCILKSLNDFILQQKLKNKVEKITA